MHHHLCNCRSLMASLSPIQFIDTALSGTGPFALSYTDPNQKWFIRKHLLSLLQDFPSLNPSMDTFIHNDGTVVRLLNANGSLHISNSTPKIHLAIWIHENYPYMAPMVIISSDSTAPIHRDHPFVDPSGATITPYMKTWQHPKCNLTSLVRNLVNLFFNDHPLSCSPTSNFAHPSLASKREAIDRLAGMLQYDMLALGNQTHDEIEVLLRLQREIKNRDGSVRGVIEALDHEKMQLENSLMRMTRDAEVLIDWLKVHVAKPQGEDEIDMVFEAEDEESRLKLDCAAADEATEDTLWVLDGALAEGVVSLEDYIKQVRVLARGQFSYRVMLQKLHYKSHSIQ